MKRKRGFTVIELLVTILIMALLMTISLGFSRHAINRANFNSSVNKFVADFSYARQLASRMNRYVAIDFDKSGGFYAILTQNQIGVFSQDKFSVDRTYHQPNNQKFFDGDTAQSLIINSMGIVRNFPMNPGDPPRSVTIEFVQENQSSWDTSKYKKQVTIYPTGGIKIEEIKVSN